MNEFTILRDTGFIIILAMILYGKNISEGGVSFLVILSVAAIFAGNICNIVEDGHKL